MGIPTRPLSVPPIVVDLAAGRLITPAWANELGGLTFQIGVGSSREFVKWCPDHPEFDLELEAAKLGWAGSYVTVPEVLGIGFDEDASWLHTRGIPGESAVSERWKAAPRAAVRAIAEGLRALHDRLPVDDCPFSWSVEHRAANIVDDADRLLAEQAPPIDKLVVCHGDACAPNTLLTPDARWSGHVDFGQLGVADRWADLAVATYSLDWNFPGHFEREFFESYGIERDPERISFYRRLWDAS